MATVEKSTNCEKEPKKKGATSIPQKDFPKVSISEIVPIIKLVYENVASGTISFNDLAKLMGSSPSTTKTKYLIWGADAYGLLYKEENSEYKLSETGRKVIAPTYRSEERRVWK